MLICTWMWGKDKFRASDVAKLGIGLRRHLRQEYRFICLTDQISGSPEPGAVDFVGIPHDDRYLLKVKGCFVRLRMFDPAWQRSIGVIEGDCIVCIDLDTVITGPLDPLFDRPEPFVIMQGGNSSNPNPFNGALQMLQAGYRPDVWTDFSLEAAANVPFHSFPDDQGWLHHKIPDAAGWKVGPEHGVYVFQKPGWPNGKANSSLPLDARLVTFINKHPSQLVNLDWIKEHWK